jgi:hypothetical protein
MVVLASSTLITSRFAGIHRGLAAKEGSLADS